ncbi:hypothetical protein Scep_003364 [Stephania cephalantha]|uniref:Uncharacterized protein n=1 Tax=Stephania cephalantha TaxID=152367 RepID=A0AAP0PVQ6_9MAGN
MVTDCWRGLSETNDRSCGMHKGEKIEGAFFSPLGLDSTPPCTRFPSSTSLIIVEERQLEERAITNGHVLSQSNHQL